MPDRAVTALIVIMGLVDASQGVARGGPSQSYPSARVASMPLRQSVGATLVKETTMSDTELFENMYAAFNRRDIDAVLALMTADVDWPNGWEGGRVRGHAAVRDYWLRQWKELDPQVTPEAVRRELDGQVVVTVRQRVKDLSGHVVADGLVEHAYRFDRGKIAAMSIR